VSEIQEILTRFWDQLIAQPSGPLAFRFILQPLMATILAIRDGSKDAQAGRSLYTWAILTDPAHRVSYLREGLKRVSRVIVFALVMDAIYQFMVSGAGAAREQWQELVIYTLRTRDRARRHAYRCAAWLRRRGSQPGPSLL
jgi:hypothetical protein